MKARNFRCVTLICIVGLFACGANGVAETIRVAHPGYSASLPILIGQKKGYYREEGLEVELILMRAVVASRALLGGNVEFAALGGAALTPIVRGAPLRILFTTIDRPMFWVYSKPNLKKLAELKGKQIGIGGIGGGPDYLLAKILTLRGMEPGRDVAFITIGSTPERFAALINGHVDAAVLSFPFNFSAGDAGFHELINFGKQTVVELNGNIVAREAFLRSKPLATEKFLRGTLKGLLYARANRSGTVSVIRHYQKVDTRLAERYYDEIVRGGLTSGGMVGDELQIEALEPALKIADLKDLPERDRVFDYSLIERIRSQLKATRWTPEE